MCGRYASSRRPERLVEEFRVAENRVDEPLPADFNVAPSKPVYAVLERTARDSEETSRQLRVLRWGLIPSWAKDPSIGNRMINARMETVAEKPAFRRAFAARRCLLPADGYFEWYPTSEIGRGGKPLKQPFFIRPRDGGVLAMAGLYEIWRDATRDEDEDGAFVWSCTVITTEAEDSVGTIHDRMPLMVAPGRWAAWLAPGQDRSDLLGLLTPAAPGTLEAFPVSRDVGNVRNNGPHLLEPLPLEGLPEDVAREVVA
jgi:putative SOS response-associated peptidase YedK